jgi:hypothetical protein
VQYYLLPNVEWVNFPPSELIFINAEIERNRDIRKYVHHARLDSIFVVNVTFKNGGIVYNEIKSIPLFI